ncbi:MAG: hypothetical protein EOP42_12650 [Sphingobacteriaceae bacterium]|nr:MAG: hypothetical protein EOP42_12650 [Sphingobacteriaceae bacterium]
MKLRYPILVVPSLKANGMALFPFILVKLEKSRFDAVMIRHEIIHLRQQLEMLVLPFYFFYLINYLYNRLIYKNHHEAYLNIVFEREAYANDAFVDYLKHRKLFSWVKYLKRQD